MGVTLNCYNEIIPAIIRVLGNNIFGLFANVIFLHVFY